MDDLQALCDNKYVCILLSRDAKGENLQLVYQKLLQKQCLSFFILESLVSYKVDHIYCSLLDDEVIVMQSIEDNLDKLLLLVFFLRYYSAL